VYVCAQTQRKRNYNGEKYKTYKEDRFATFLHVPSSGRGVIVFATPRFRDANFQSDKIDESRNFENKNIHLKRRS
jgi:hypothetical protein